MSDTFFTTEDTLRLLNEVSVGILVLDTDKRIIYTNTWLLTAAELPEKDVIGQPLNEVFSEPFTGRLSAAIEVALTAQRSTQLSNNLNKVLFPLRNPDGTDMHQHVTVKPFGGASSSPRCLVQIEDVTGNFERETLLKLKRKESEADQAYLNAILQGTTEGILVTDDEGIIQSLNATAEKLFGFKYQDILGEPVTILIPERYCHAYTEGIKRIREGKTSEVAGKTLELHGLRKDGSEFPIEVSLYSWNIANKEVFAASIRDVTENKALEELVSKKIAELRFQTLALDEHAIVSITDVKGNITYANDKFCDISEFSRSELLGQNHRILKSDRHSTAFYSDMWQTIACGKPWHGEIRNKKKHGGYYWVKATIVPSLNSQGKPFQYVAIRTDITDRKEMEQQYKTSEERYRQLAAVSSDWVWEMDKDLKFSYMSEGFRRVYAVDPKYVLGKSREQLLSAVDLSKPQWQQHLSALKERRTFRDFQYQLATPDGDKVYVKISGAPVFDKDNQFLGYRGSGSDVTGHVESAHALKQARQVADKANRAKSEFLSSMSHELRTPMNSIIGFGQMLENNTREPLSEIQKKCVGHIMKGGRHLLELINEVLDLSKVEAGSVELDPEVFCPSDVYSECQDLLQELAGERAITFNRQQESARWILADRFRFKQVILNLISNAIKYNNERGSVTFGCQDKPDGIVRIFVTDTGDGIPEEQIPELFTPFERLQHKNSEIEGTGIGLTITKRLVEAMGGSIGCDSKVGEGTTFWLEFPQANKTPDATTTNIIAETPVLAPSEISGTLLYIEDDRHNTALMELIVTRIEGLSMISAPTAELGLEMAASERPDMILLDINLPGMDGYQAIAHLKENEKTRDIPVIALSAAAMSHDIERGKKAGFMHYLTKPIDIDEVISVIDGVIKSRASQPGVMQ